MAWDALTANSPLSRSSPSSISSTSLVSGYTTLALSSATLSCAAVMQLQPVEEVRCRSCLADVSCGLPAGQKRQERETACRMLAPHLVDDRPVPNAVLGPQDVDLLVQEFAADIGASEGAVDLYRPVAPQPEPP